MTKGLDVSLEINEYPPLGTMMLIPRQTPTNSRDPTSVLLLPILSSKK